MAIYHLSHGVVSRSSGRSSVQSAAYITGTDLHETRRDLDVSYKNRHSDIAFTDTLAPEHATQQFRDIGVWDILENFEDSYAEKRFPRDLDARDKYLNSAQTAQTIVMALPRELEVGVAKELVEEFALTRFVSRGLIVTYAIHDDEGNPHAHLLISRRSVGEDGSLSWAKDREIVTRKELLVTRKIWADLTNKYLELEGFDVRITEKSFADLGVNLEPTQHRGWVSDKLEAMGVTSRIVVENAEVFARNREALIERPAEILPEMTSKAATFTQLNLLKAIQKRIGDDDKIVAQVFEGALQYSIVVGEGMNGEIRYTTQTYKDIEEQAVNKVSELIATPFAQSKLSKDKSFEHIESNFAYLSQEQKEAVLGLTQDQSLAVLIGRAGAGKTTTLKAVSEIYQNAGYRVIGASLSAMAAENLGQEAGIKAATIHSLLYKWDRYQAASEKFLSFDSVMEEGIFKQLDWYKDLKRFEGAKLTKDTVLIVDEAGMVGTHQWGELLSHVQRAGSKLIAVGDDNQFKAIEAGDFFREFKNQGESQAESITDSQGNKTTHLFSLQEIRRQQHKWMREASYQLAELNISEGLSAYEQHGHINQTSRPNLSEDIATAYLNKLKSGFSEDQQAGLVLAFTNAQTNSINQAIREQLKQNGMIGKEDLIKLNCQNFTIGDKIVFLKNNKTDLKITDVDGVVQTNPSIKNATSGVIQGVNHNGDITIALKDNLFTVITCNQHIPKVAIGQPQPEPIREYNYTHIQHGYAVTTHKSQGQTVDFTIVAASKHMDAKGLYVAMTRHRDDVQLFYSKEDFPTFKSLTSQLSRFEHKDLGKDYTIRAENEAAWQRVQEYRLCALDAAAELKQQSGQIDWQTYNQIKQDQVRIGKEILSDFSKHQLYINQAGLTQEMLQISTGQKNRPLSMAEEKAKITVELYGETAHLARGMWNSIRKTHPGSKCYSHNDYEKFNEIRHERNSLAQTIAENYSLHREFVNQFSRVYGINSKTVEAQSKQFIQSQSTDKYSEKTEQLWYNNGFDNTSYGKYTTSAINLNSTKIVDLPPTLPHKWDLADKVPEGIKIKEILVNAVEQRADRTTTKFLETAQVVNQITQEANTDQATRTIGIEDIYKHCKNHYMSYRITPENTEFIVKVTNDTYQELQQWTSLSGFSADDSKLEVQAALTGVYADMFKTITKQRPNALDKSIDIGKIAGKMKMDMSRANLQEDKAIVLSASRLYDKQDMEISALVQSKDISGYTHVVHKEILKATTRCHSMTGDYLSKEMKERLLGETKMACGMENDSQKAKAAIGEICARLAREASPTVDRPLTIQEQREKSVVDYISAELNSKNNSLISGSTDAFLRSKLVKDPMGALETWKKFTNNQNCFTPMSFAEMQIKTQEANALLESQKANMTEEVHDKLKATMSTNPQEVIQQCRGVIEFQLDKARQKDINKYTELSKAFLKLPYNDREDSSAAKELNEIANRHQNDEKFNQAITKNDLTRQVQESLHEPNKLEIHRGFER
jgi:ATP-dependent exoDNAse (exonuclease V) alpha subunit